MYFIYVTIDNESSIQHCNTKEELDEIYEDMVFNIKISSNKANTIIITKCKGTKDKYRVLKVFTKIKEKQI